MRNKWSLLSVICIIIGVFGLLKYGLNTSEEEAAFSKRWTFGAQELKLLAIDTDYSVDVQFVQSANGENYVEAKGNAVKEVIDRLESAALQNGQLGLDMQKKTWNISFFDMNFHSSQQQITVALSDTKAFDELRVNTSSDDVKVTGAQAHKVELKSSSGDLALDNVQADSVNVQTSSGDIDGSGVTGALQATSSSGDVRIDRVDGNATAKSSSGDVRLTFANTKTTSIETSSGDVNVTVPNDFGGFYDVSTSSGSIDTPDSKRTTTDVIKIRTSSGDVTVKQ